MRIIALTLSIIVTSAFCNITIAQDRLLQKSWIKTSIEEIRKAPEEADTTYLRYEFDDAIVHIGFEPSCHFIQTPFSRRGNKLILGDDRWTIETLTDSTLTIFLPGFRRMKFFAEDYLQTKEEYLVKIGEYNGKPLYKVNRIITPRYKNPNGLHNDIVKQDRADDYNIRKAGIFLMSFIITTEGNIEQPKIIKSVAPGYDGGIIKELLKSSKQWTPAKFRGQPIQTLMYFEIKFLDSLH